MQTVLKNFLYFEKRQNKKAATQTSRIGGSFALASK